ncbi:hypothetical protein K443DRAFT_153929 [Laccaria amethystina LaAM-08-1]|uniref:Uncharacterized protein n=1 Tax=Laccaria amethystina LaAM-08-1 TaxID=1095629 RepID=A0A0C9XQK2_9AGAR|nr:hypothetical protein K443DRAFT_153929 [Laccaria amethystina LaAM-08-1]
MHHVETMSTFIQLQSWQMVCHSGPPDGRATPAPQYLGRLHTQARSAATLLRLGSRPPRNRRCDRGDI